MTLGINVMEESIDIPIPMYIDENGNEQTIDLAVKTSGDPIYKYENTTNSIKTYFKENICDYSPIKVVTDKGFFEWTPFGVGFQDEYENELWLGRINDIVADTSNVNKVVYRNCVTGIDEEFVVDYGKLKHNTILNSLPIYDNSLVGKDIGFIVDGKMDFSSEISMFVDDQIQTGDFTTYKSIVFKNVNDETVFTLPEPITYEVNSYERIKCRYKVKMQGSVVSLKIIVPYEWLENPVRNYPIAIDPTLEVVATSNLITRAKNATFSHSGEYFAISTYTDTKSRLFRVNNQLKRIDEMPMSAKGYPGRAEYAVCFSPDDQYFLYGGYSTLNVYKFNKATQDYDIQTYTSSVLASAISFSSDGKYVLAGNNYDLVCYEFDYGNGTLKKVSSFYGGYRPLKTIVTKNGKFILHVQSNLTDSTTWFRLHTFTNGIVGAETAPANIPFNYIMDFALTEDEKFVVFALQQSPYLVVCPFDADTGNFGAPIAQNSLVLLQNITVRNVALSKKENFLVVNQTVNNKVAPLFTTYKFNKLNGQIESKYYEEQRTSGAQCRSLGFSDDGEYFYFTLDNSNDPNNNALVIYKFFHDPHDNLYFKDLITNDYYSDNKGKTILLIDFGNMIAGTNSLPKKILLENNNDFAVKDILLVNDNNDPNFSVVLSKTETPFNPEKDLDFGAVTLNPKESVEFYIQITTTDKSLAGGMFELTVKYNEA